MKRALLTAVLVALAVGLYAQIAPAVQYGVTPAQFAGLKAQVAALKKQIKTLNVVVGGCLLYKTMPTSIYGNPPVEGFNYTYADGHTGLSTAMDRTSQGSQPDAYLVALNPACTSALGSFSAYKFEAASSQGADAHYFRRLIAGLSR